MANPIISGLNNFFSGLRGNTATSGDKGAPAAVGNTSDSTIAAAEAETTKQTTQTQTPSNRNSPTTKRREESEAAKALTEEIAKQESNSSSPSSSSPTTNWRNSAAGNAISLGTATDAQKVEALEQGASAQNVGFTNVDAIPEGKYINEAGKLDDVSNLLKDATVEKSIVTADGKQEVQTIRFNELSAEEQARYDTDAFADDISRQNIADQTTPEFEVRTVSGLPSGSREDIKTRYEIERAKGTTATPGLKEAAEEIYRQEIRENLIIGNYFTTGETLFTNPDGSVNLNENIFKQLDDWNAYDSSGEFRKNAAVMTAVEIPTYFFGGGIVGAGGKVVQTGINKVGATAIGGKIVDFATSPIIKPASIVNPATHPKITAVLEGVTTPTAAAVNIATGLYLADVGARIAAQPTAEKKIEYAGNVALKEIPFGIAGAVRGYSVADSVGQKLYTFGKTEIPFDKIGVKGIPLGDYTPNSLRVSFEENKLIPAPFKIAQTNNPYYPKTSGRLAEGNTNYLEAWHATGSGQYFGKRFTVAEGSSELSGIYTAPKVVSHFLGVNNYTPMPAAFVSKFGRAPESKAVNFRVNELRYLDWDKAAKDAGFSRTEVNKDWDKRKAAGDAYINKVSIYGDITAPLMKKEYEAVIKPGSEFKRLRRKYYTRYNDRVIPIDEYKPTNAPPEIPGNVTLKETNTTGKQTQSSDSIGNRINQKAFEIGEQLGKNFAERLMARFETPNARIRVPVRRRSSSSSRERTTGNRVETPAFSVGRIDSARSSSPLESSSIKSVRVSSFSVSPSSPSAVSGSSSKFSGMSSRKSSGSSSNKALASSSKYTSSSYSFSPAKYPPYSKKEEYPQTKIKPFTAARTGRIDHLSIVDPAEMLGIGSLTNRNRPDRIMRKQELYFVDGKLTQKKPRGRVRK